MSEFDQKAAGWDMNEVHKLRSQSIADKLIKMIPEGKHLSALEFGAGTGLLSFLLSKYLKKITLVDSSKGMIDVIAEKLASGNEPHLKPLLIDLEKESISDQFDLIFSQMAFHHVVNVDAMLLKFYTMLSPGGWVAIADLYPEDGSFHGVGFTGHLGFDPDGLAQKLLASGFRDVSYGPCFVMTKELGPNETRDYPVFLMSAFR